MPWPLSTSGKILVTGARGQLAQALARHGTTRIQLTGRPDFDFDRPETLEATLEAYAPSAVINAAAWTAVDLAEREPQAAARANTTGPERLARLCAQRQIPLLHVSTDYVFDGTKGAPYIETDPVSPRSVYGRTKAEGEKAVLAACPCSVIVRTAWLYSAYGDNFLKKILSAGATNPVLRIVDDQYGNPTNADDLAVALLSILTRIEQHGWHPDYAGLYHASGCGSTTWHGMATAALEIAAARGSSMPDVLAIRAEDWPTPARRPVDTRLDCTKLSLVFGLALPAWEKSLEQVVAQIINAS
jgi:dTDP-4-dehydrorhamnose reductase